MMKADEQYRRLLKILERDPKIDEEEIEMFKKTEIITKCIEQVKARAKAQEHRRKSPEEFAESRLKKNLEIQRSLSPVGGKRSRSKKGKEGAGA
jgi:hypothetical protein